MLKTSSPAGAPLAPNEEDDAPLDPAMERVRRKLTILLAVSTGVMVLGFLAVVLAIFYRVSQAENAAGPAAIELAVAPGELVSVSAGAEHVTLTIAGEDPRVEVRRLSDGDLVSVFRLSGVDDMTPKPPR